MFKGYVSKNDIQKVERLEDGEVFHLESSAMLSRVQRSDDDMEVMAMRIGVKRPPLKGWEAHQIIGTTEMALFARFFRISNGARYLVGVAHKICDQRDQMRFNAINTMSFWSRNGG